MEQRTWSQPYFGVSHRMMGYLQLTTCDYGPFVEAKLFHPSTHGFETVVETTIFRNRSNDAITEAQHWCEAEAEKVSGLMRIR